MTVAVEQEKEMAEFGSESNNVNPSDYSCQVLLERTTLEAANDKSFPTDARLIWYIVGNQKFIDLVRCGKVSVFFWICVCASVCVPLSCLCLSLWCVCVCLCL